MRSSKKTVTAAIVGLLVVAAPASAQVLNPTVGSYSAPAATIQTTVTPQHSVSPSITSSPTAAPTTTAAATTTSGNTLPFTGLQVGLVVLAGAALLGVGLAVRRLARPPHSS